MVFKADLQEQQIYSSTKAEMNQLVAGANFNTLSNINTLI